ncbi:hypothetical protein AWZ03_009914 [Drosophila navojoa]|uniref:Uncharacterized protein n=1 Tax=Drosophila navojoa TaxID=7232 RepID=A0A484B746_DRONA|nr:uncharacterized protein LOC108656233 [Drosophila navojoa]TDG43671.1 hypothetical protein AWZ03_009914 [Drosophila navojoa]
MSHLRNGSKNTIESDSDDEDYAKLRLFAEATDHTLLRNDMYKKELTTASSPEASAPQALPKSERYLADQDAAPASDLQISKEMQTHLWGKLTAIIQNQVEYCEVISDQPTNGSLKAEKENAWFSQVKLLSNADCYVVDDIEPKAGPQKRPTIKRRQLEDDKVQAKTDATLAAIAVDGDSILSGRDMQSWVPRKPRKDKFFEYRATDALGHKLQAIEPTNEFTKQRRKNNWNETKIGQRFRNKQKKA